MIDVSPDHKVVSSLPFLFVTWLKKIKNRTGQPQPLCSGSIAPRTRGRKLRFAHYHWSDSQDERPCAIIVHLHYYTEKEKILKLSKDWLVYNGSRIHIFPYMSPEVGRLRASFNQVKAKLCDTGIQYSLDFAAKLLITMNGSKHAFTDSWEAGRFTQDNLQAPTWDT